MQRLAKTWFCLLLTGSLPTIAFANPPATQPQSAQEQTPHPQSVPIIQLHGSGTEMGTQQGQQLRDQIRQLHQQYLQQFIRNDSQRHAAIVAAAIFEAELPPEYRDEVHALSVATGLDEHQVMLAQCFLDLTSMMACSTVALPADGSADGIPRMGRNLDFPSFDIADKASVLIIFHPTGKFAFAAVSWPGMLGVLSGMNDQGLCLANMEVKRNARFPSALPYTLLYRSLLEQCRTVDDAIAFLNKTPRQSANNLMLIDAAGNRAVAEITPEGVHVRRAPRHQRPCLH